MIAVMSDGSDTWTALRDNEVVGRLRTLVRPDRRCFLFVRDDTGAACGPLLDAALPVLGRQVRVEVDEDAVEMRAVLAERGFTVDRREHRYVIPTDQASWSGLPDGFDVVSAADTDVDRWRELDDALRQDVPGTAGWRNDPAEFVAREAGDPGFDPATYLLAVERGGGAYAGLVRVWDRPDVPRLGLIGTLPRFRRRGLAVALIAAAFGVMRQRGETEVCCEVDVANTASNSLMRRLRARRVGGNVELAWSP